MKYKLNPDVVLVTVLDESMLISVNKALNGVESMRGVNETGAYYWRLMERGLDIDEIVASAMRDYDIPEETARPSFMRYLKGLQSSGCLTIEE